MDKTSVKNRIEKLKQEINIHRYNYHVLDKETLSEAALDGLKNELFKLEQQFPEFITSDSPSQRVGGQPLDKFVKSEHLSPMISLYDAFTPEDIRAWEERNFRYLSAKNLKINNNFSYYCELKLDGLALNLKYYQGVFQEGASRGDGRVGENISSNVKTIASIPLELIIPEKKDLAKLDLDSDKLLNHLQSEWIEVRGEAIMTKSTLARLNTKYQAEKKPLLANTRNGAAGSLRQLDPKLSAERKLVFYPYDLIFYKKGKKVNIVPSREKAELLSKMLGFEILPHNILCKNLDEVIAFHRQWEKNRDELDFNIDGLVVKVNDLAMWEKLGTVGKAPRYAMAYKFSAEQGSTIIKDVVWQLGRTGILTPTAILEPVNLLGVIISRATLHNMDEIKRLDVKIGDTVVVERAGDVIPKIVSVFKKLRDGSEQKICTPKKCPNCGSEVVREGEEVALRCSNPRCFAVNLRQIIHFVSKPALDIENIGPKVIEQLLNEGLISDLADLFYLKKEDLLSLDRFAEKSSDNLISAVANKKKILLARFIYALGIRHIGEESAMALANYLNSGLAKKGSTTSVSGFVNFIKKLKEEDFSQIDDFGPKASASIVSFFQDQHNLNILDKLNTAKIRLELKDESEKEESSLAQAYPQIFQKSFALTGTLASLTRDEAKAKIRERGGRILSAISANLDYLIVGQNPGSKEKKAQDLKIKIINEADFLQMIK